MKSLENPLSSKKPTKRLFGSQKPADFEIKSKDANEVEDLRFDYEGIKLNKESFVFGNELEDCLEEANIKYIKVHARSKQKLFEPGEVKKFVAKKLERGVKDGKIFNLTLSQMHLTRLPKLPSSMENFNCFLNDIEEILAPLPQNLRILSFSYNKVTKLPNLPPLITTIHCDHNNLTELPPIPPSLEVLKYEGNPLTSSAIQKITDHMAQKDAEFEKEYNSNEI